MLDVDIRDFLPKKSPPMTFRKFMSFINLPENEDKKFELVEGYVVAMSSPTSNHQRISFEIARQIGNYLIGKKCEVFMDLNVHLFQNSKSKRKNVYRPDVFVGCDPNKATSRGYEGAPEWIVEVVSKSSSRYDYFVKCMMYMNYGVKEYWVVDIFNNHIIAHQIPDKNTHVVGTYTFDDRIKVGIFDDLFIDFKEVLPLISNE